MRPRFKLLIATLLTYLFVACPALAQVDTDQDALSTKLDNFEEIITEQTPTLEQLYSIRRGLSKIILETKGCIDHSQAQLTLLNDIFSSIQQTQTAENQSPNAILIDNKRQHFNNELAGCKIIEYRAKELTANVNSLLHQVDTSRILRQKKNIIENTSATITWLNNPEVQFDFASVFTIDSQDIIFLYWMGALIAVYLLFLINFKSLRRRYLFIKNNSKLVKLLAPSLIFSIYIGYYEYLDEFDLSIFHNAIAAIIAGYFFLTFLINHSIDIIYNSSNLPPNKKEIRRNNRYYFLVIISLSIIYIFTENMKLPDDVIGLMHQISFILGTIATCIYLHYLPKLLYSRFLKKIFTALIPLIFVINISLEGSGYHSLTEFIARGLLISITIILSTIILLHWTKIAIEKQRDIFISLSNNPEASNLSSFEITITKNCFYLLFLVASVIFFLRAWDFPPTLTHTLQTSLLDGFAFYNLNINPLRLLLAVLVFSILQYISKTVLDIIFFKHTDDDEIDVEATVYTVFYYLGMVASFIIALLVSGVSMTSLTIIAGALSVGIGLGLQTIIYNIVSGMILMVEKPIKPGDRILFNDKEGFVKKINFRATIVSTLLKEDLIIPNSEFIGKPFLNFVYRNHTAYIRCSIQVAFASDTKLVHDTLLEVARNHPLVLDNEKDKILILFNSVGDSSLNFTLWVCIADVNQKFIVQSSLNFAIIDAFRANNITIAHPQMDVHFDDNVHVAR